MSISNISFGQKIPLMKCNIKDRKKNTNIPVIISEYDCRHRSDFKDVLCMRDDFYYFMDIACNMQDKYIDQKENTGKNNSHFYIMNSEDGKNIGICQTKDVNGDVEIEYIESVQNGEYKYAGQSMIASVCKKMLESKANKVIILAPVIDCLDFYIKKCGFKPSDENFYRLEADRNNAQRLIDSTQEKTGSPILNING